MTEEHDLGSHRFEGGGAVGIGLDGAYRGVRDVSLALDVNGLGSIG